MAAPDLQAKFARYLTGAPNEDGEIRAWCPEHEDPDTSETPSASFNFLLGVWHCMGCGSGGAIKTLYQEMRAKRRAAREHELGLGGDDSSDNVIGIRSKRGGPRQAKAELPGEDDIALWHERLMKQPRLLSVMVDERGLSEQTLKEFQIGHDGTRYTIPVRDVEGALVNVRRYNPKAVQAKDKMLNITGHGTARIYGVKELEAFEEVIISEGEMDRLIGVQHGLPVVTHTAGAGTFRTDWGPLFTGKVVFICYDNDEQGNLGAIKAAKIIKQHASAVYIIRLPIDLPKGDLTDYFVKFGYSAEDFRTLMEQVREHPFAAKRAQVDAPTGGKRISVEESMSTTHGNEPLEMIVAIAGKQNPPYVLPKTIHAVCDQDKGNVCAVCPMSAWNGEHKEQVSCNDPILLDFIDANDKIKKGTLRQIVGARCADRIDFTVTDSWSVEELLITNSVDHRGHEDQAPISRRVLNVGTYRTPINTTARIVGSQLPDPKSQRGLFLSWYLEQTQTNLDRFKMTEDLIRRLSVFQPNDRQTVMDKLTEIADDLAANVTRIYGRPELHVAYDLVWHSVLGFSFLGKPVEKGWLECLVMGDTRTGKSEGATQLAKHYNAGMVKSCEGATFAGLVGGVQQLGNKWMVTWGVIPLNDRRLVVLDEVSGLKDRDVIENMSAIRSSGKAQLTKIAVEETSARTRMIWISNPVDGSRLHEASGSAMHAIAKLVPNPEDVARFDFALAAAGSDVDIKLINTASPPKVKHRYRQPLCEALVLWAWSRAPEQVLWEAGCEEHVVRTAIEVGSVYVSDPPLVQAENIRMKLARLAVAIAARVFSASEDGECILVRREHVDAAVQFLNQVYGMEAMGYQRHSRRVLGNQRKAKEQKSWARQYLEENRETVLHGLLAIGDNTFKPRDFEDFAGMDRTEAQIMVRNLLENRMIRRMSRGAIKMEPALIELLREFEDSEADEV